MALSLSSTLTRLFITPYRPQPDATGYLARLMRQEGNGVAVSVAVLDAHESERHFGVALARRGMQPVFIRVENHSEQALRLQLVRTDPNYYTPLEAAGANHFSIVKRLSAFGALGWMFFWLFLPLLAVLPSKLYTAWRANRRMDELFQSEAFHLRPVPPGETTAGFVFTPLDVGTKVVHVCLQPTGNLLDQLKTDKTMQEGLEFTFSVPVPGISADYLKRDFATLIAPGAEVKCDLPTLVDRLTKMPPTTTNTKDTHQGDPANLVVIGSFATILGAFAARWDESETITLATCWKTARSFLLGSQYRYSPVSPLHLFGRSQDVALQRARRSINERLHLRLWLTPLTYEDQPVWLGQVSRDIGVRFTTKVWNLTTHRIDPDVDEARDYVLEDLLHAERVDAAGYVDGVGDCLRTAPRHNLTGDPYFTDGKRVVVLLSASRSKPRFVAW